MPFLAICPEASLKIHERAPSYEEQVLLFVPEDLPWRGCNSRYLRKSICSNQSGCVAGSLSLSSHGGPKERERPLHLQLPAYIISSVQLMKSTVIHDTICLSVRDTRITRPCLRYCTPPLDQVLIHPPLMTPGVLKRYFGNVASNYIKQVHA